jgi:orotidine-5'-phosphate decarboxylase
MTIAADSKSLQPSVAAERGAPFIERLARRIDAVGTMLCLGIDPDPEALPASFARDVTGIEEFSELLLDAALPYAAAVKINLAFFEAFGVPGVAALERVRARIAEDVPFVADAKRADIGSTAARQAVALYDVLDAHAVTVSPYLGGEAIAPLLERSERLVYVLCRTSNPGAGEFQNLELDGEPLYIQVARHARKWAAERVNVGLVIGATAPNELERIREATPDLPFLVPGVGAQGGDVDAVVKFGRATAGAAAGRGGSLLVNVSRGIAGAALDAHDPGEAIASAAASWAATLRC